MYDGVHETPIESMRKGLSGDRKYINAAEVADDVSHLFSVLYRAIT